MTPTKKIILTFDYELFLGAKSGHPDKCIHEPMDLLLDVFKRHQAKCIFFVDILYLYRLSNVGLPQTKADFDKIKTQLQLLKKLGHDLFCHLHPHWLDAVYNEKSNEWDLSNVSRYRFPSLPKEEQSFVFDTANQLFKSILGNEHEMEGYRAGGLCIQEFETFKPFFEQFNVRFEFSVMPGFHQKSKVQYFNFENAPKENIYHFEDDVLKPIPNGKFKQFQITTLPNLHNHKRLLRKYWNKILWRLNIRHFGNGIPSSGFPIGSDNLGIASIENMDIFSRQYYLDYLSKNDYLQLISHPKAINKHNIASLDYLLTKANEKYNLTYDFRKM